MFLARLLLFQAIIYGLIFRGPTDLHIRRLPWINSHLAQREPFKPEEHLKRRTGLVRPINRSTASKAGFRLLG